MKYEFKSTGRIYLPLFGALIIVAAVSRLFMSLSFKVPQFIGISVSVIMIIAICVITLLLTIQRFYKNLLGNEGYLMFTLPVHTDQLIWSKLLVASIWNVVSLIVVLLAVAIMAMTGITLRDIVQAFQEMSVILSSHGGKLFLIIMETLLLFVISLFSSILMLYACMAVSLLFNKHRGLISFGAYIVYSIIGQTLASILATVGLSSGFFDNFNKFTPTAQFHYVIAVGILWTAVSGAVFYVLTRFMLKRKLNLE